MTRKLGEALHHPDLNPGKPEATHRRVQGDHRVGLWVAVGPGEARPRTTAGRSTPRGTRSRRSSRSTYDVDPGGRYGGGPNLSPEDLESLLGAAFAEQLGRRRRNRRGADAHYGLTVSFLDAANGAIRRLSLPEGRTLDVTIPAGLRDGHVLRHAGQGCRASRTGAAGDAPLIARSA